MTRYTFILFILLLATGALSAQFPQKAGDHVDYSRIIRPHLPGSHSLIYTFSGGERPFTFTDTKKGFQVLRSYQSGKKVTMDDIQKFNAWGESKNIELTFNGELLRTRDLTDEDIENAIQFALRQMSWSRDDVLAANTWVEKIRSVNYSVEDFWKDMLAVMGVASTVISIGAAGSITGLNPLDPGVTDLIFQVAGTGGNVVMASSSEQYAQEWQEQTMDYLSNTAASGGAYIAGDIVMSTLGSFKDLATAMEKADDRQKQLTKNRVADTFERKLEQFYTLINAALPQQRGEIWMIYVTGSAVEDFTFEETLCRQKCTINMYLKNGYDNAWKEADPKSYIDGFEGIYMGTFDAHLEFNLSNYDATFTPNTEDHVWTALTSSNIRAIGLQWKVNQLRLGGNFNYAGTKTLSSAHHILPVMVEIKKSKRDSETIITRPKIIERDMLKRTVSGLPQKKSESSFSTSHSYKYTVSGDGFTYDGFAKMYTENDSTLVTEAHQDLKTPRGQNAIEAVALAFLRAMFFVDGKSESSSNYGFRKETYPIGTIDIDLQTATEEEQGIRFY